MRQSVMMRILAFVLIMAVVVLAGCSDGDNALVQPGEGSQPDVPTSVSTFLPIHYKTIDLPSNIRPMFSTWSPDGSHVIFSNIVDGEIWLVEPGSLPAQCLTCDVDQIPKMYSAFSYIFPDQQRVLIANELGSRVYILACQPSVAQCNKSKVYPVDLSADKVKGRHPVTRRTFHLAPDGEHLAYTKVRLDAMIMIIGRLEKKQDKYLLTDLKVINPPEPDGPNDPDAEGWAHQAELYEFKSFADRGASALVTTGGTGFDPDTIKINLKTGAITRMSTSPDWDEDGAVSPDGEYFISASWRTMDRLTPLGLFPFAKDFIGYPLTAVIAFNYVSSFSGFQCDLQPWLLPGSGDHGYLTGQPLKPYDGGKIIASNNLVGARMWSPDSTKVLIRELLTTPPPPTANEVVKVKGLPPSRLMIAKLEREPSELVPAVETVVGDWASTPAGYEGPFGPGNKTVSIRGDYSGSIQIVYNGLLINLHDQITYNHYSENGKVFISGMVSLVGNVQQSITFKVNLTATNADGEIIGTQKGELQFTAKQDWTYTENPWMVTGHFTSTYNGQKASSLPKTGRCLESFPRPSPVLVTPKFSEGRLHVKVAANIHGDKRPIMNANVNVNGKTVETGSRGMTVFNVGARDTYTVRVRAGDTFIPKTLTVNR